MTLAVAVLGALAVGYLAGRARPIKRVSDWNWDRTIYDPKTTRLDFLLWVLLHPVLAVATFRRGEPEIHAAPEVGERWRQRAAAPDEEES